MHSFRKWFFPIAPLVLTLLMSVFALAKTPQPATGSEPAPASVQQSDSVANFAVNVKLVNLFFTVKDATGVPVHNLSQAQFEVFEDGKPQNIKYFKADATQPLTLGLLVDTSGSTRRILPFVRQIGTQFLGNVLGDKDLAFLMSFDVGVDLLRDLTAPGPDLRVALRETNSDGGDWLLPGKEGFPGTQKGERGTLLYDAIYLAATEELQHEVGRKVIVIITDGIDQGSQTSLAATIEAAQKVDALVYVLLAYDHDYGARSQDIGKICKETGGRVIEVAQKPGGLEKAIQQVSDELRTQYYVGYTPTQNADGSFRKLQVRVKGGDYRVQVRKGYYAPKE
jgi:VWFA-related protein